MDGGMSCRFEVPSGTFLETREHGPSPQPLGLLLLIAKTARTVYPGTGGRSSGPRSEPCEG